MKINNSGWGLPHLLLGIAIIFIFLLIATFLTLRLDSELNLTTSTSSDKKETINQSANNDETTYYIDKVTDFTTAANKYLDKESITLEQDSYIKIQLSTLVFYNYLTDINDYYTNNACTGYALANLDTNNIRNVSVYLKCDNFTSKGYEK